MREATIAGDDLREIIAFEPEKKVTFFQARGPREGAIVNELFEDEAGALQLRFYCYTGLRGKEPSVPKSRPSRPGWTATRATRVRADTWLHRAPLITSRTQFYARSDP